MKKNLYSQAMLSFCDCASNRAEAQQQIPFEVFAREASQSYLVALACQQAEVYFASPTKNFQPNPASNRNLRSERRESCLAVFKILLKYLDLETLCVGHWSTKGDFIPLDIATIASEAGLGRRRCERAISHLKKIGFVSVFPPQHYCNPVPHAGLRVVRAITPAFFEWAGLSEQLEQVRTDSLRSIEIGGGQP